MSIEKTSKVGEGNILNTGFLTRRWVTTAASIKRAMLTPNSHADDTVIGQRVNPACYIADAFPASLHLGWKYADEFEAGVIANANVGGDSCHRGAVVGALLGAAAGTGRIPARFCDGLHDAPALRRQMEQTAPLP